MSILLFAQMTAFGPAILVVCCLALMAIIGFFFTTYYCHCFLLVVIESAAGVNEVRWPSESIVEWITKPIYVFWVLLPLLVPPFVMLVATGSGIAFGVTVLLLLWLVAPLFFLSSLAAKSWLALLYGPLLARWARYPHAYVIFLVWSGAIIVIGTGLLAWSLVSLNGVVLGAIVLPPLCLLYFRILGRYGWYISTRRMGRVKKKPQKPVKGLNVASLDPWAPPDEDRAPPLVSEPPEPLDGHAMMEAASNREKLAPAAKFAPPQDDVAAEEEDEWSPNKKPYGVMTEEQAKESWVKKREGTAATDAEGYAVSDLTIGAPISLFQYYSEREEKEEVLRRQGKAVRQYEKPRKPPTLTQAMTQEIAVFLLFPHTLRAWIMLFMLFGIELALLYVVAQITRIIG